MRRGSEGQLARSYSVIQLFCYSVTWPAFISFNTLWEMGSTYTDDLLHFKYSFEYFTYVHQLPTPPPRL
jgi:hypothetical protein